jgi:hypothetical protein
MSLNRDDFPDPLGPIRPIFWSCWISQVRSLKIVLAPRMRVALIRLIDIIFSRNIKIKTAAGVPAAMDE